MVPTILPANATNKSITWLSQNATIAAVADGVVFGNMEGTTTIIAKIGNHTATCEVIVKSSLEGTKWIGTDIVGDRCELDFTNETDCRLSFIDYNEVYHGTYTFNSPNILLRLSAFGNLSGTVVGNQMTLESGEYTINLTKQ